MSNPGANILKSKGTQAYVADLISQGKSRKEVIEWLKEQGMSGGNLHTIYYNALKELVPEENFLEDSKKFLIQQNLDRLEQIINTSISGNTGEKKVALQAIDTLNKMLGVYGTNNGVIINKNNQGEEHIIISFGD